jgi:hypothetical protein
LSDDTQYNRRKFISISHEQNFGLPAKWHFFATSHGKGPADGIAGAAKKVGFKGKSTERVQ